MTEGWAMNTNRTKDTVPMANFNRSNNLTW